MNPATDSTHRLYRLCTDVRYRIVGGQAVIIVQEAGEAVVLNEVGTRVLELIDTGRSFAEIADDLCSRFDVDRKQAERDLGDYLKDLVDAGVVETTSPEKRERNR